MKVKYWFLGLFAMVCILNTQAQSTVDVAEGWAKNSVNTVVFRKNAITSYKNVQLLSYYDEAGQVMLAKRNIKSKKWTIHKTGFIGNPEDAHRSISIAVDGDGYVHLSWDHHNTRLRYAKSKTPLGLDFEPESSMTGEDETKVTYPEFYNMPDGGLLFFYRDGGSGNGNLMINRYDPKTKKWSSLQRNLIDGEGQRNAYWQACVDVKGIIHISWTWRESPDVASNHDICYARSVDGGSTWEKSNGEKYRLPITQSNAEYVAKIPQNSELINQTSMTADKNGNIFIATYWRDAGETVPQFHVVQNSGDGWQVQNLGFRKAAFSLKGGGTKRIPISRPQIISWQKGGQLACGVIFRDEERGSRLSIAINDNIKSGSWKVQDLTDISCGSSEPLFDAARWQHRQQLYLFVQKTEQVDAEGQGGLPPQMVKVVKWDRK